MKNLTRILLLFFVLGSLLAGAASANAGWIDRSEVTICPAKDDDVGPPSIDRTGCEVVPMSQVNPHRTHIWVMSTVAIGDVVSTDPLGLQVSVKASSEAFLNGVRLGANGRPATQAEDEIPGAMDHIFAISPDLLREGENDVALRMSAHHGVVRLRAPVHWIGIIPYRVPQRTILQAYWVSMLPFGALVLGGLSFLTMAGLGRERVASALLAAMALVAAAQLTVEVSRGLVAYSYPFHGVRLWLIALFSAVFGACLATYTIWRFRRGLVWPLVGITLVATLVAVWAPRGFDGKAGFALFVPTLLSIGVAFSRIKSGGRDVVLYVAALIVFALINVFGAGRFLDQYFYYSIAVLLVFLFVQQARDLAREEDAARHEKDRADKLQYILDRVATDEPETFLSVVGAGTTQRIKISDIAYVQGAGDYAELVMTNGETHLHGETLARLETTLEGRFLRVHRSYLVNTALIASLERFPSGTGELSLSTDQKLPVSRRIMPKVRASLS